MYILDLTQRNLNSTSAFMGHVLRSDPCFECGKVGTRYIDRKKTGARSDVQKDVYAVVQSGWTMPPGRRERLLQDGMLI